MIRSAPVAKALALSLAIAAHGALAMVLVAPEEIRIEGAGGAAEVRLGSAFADMAAGTLTAQSADERAEPVEAQDTSQDAPDHIAAQTPTSHAPTPAIEMADRAEPVATPAIRPEPTTETAPIAALAAATPSADAVLPLTQQTRAPTEPLSALQPRPVPDDTRAEPLTAMSEANPAVTRSLRPKPRSADFETAHKPAPAPKATPRKTQKTSKKPTQTAQTTTGNAPKDAQAGVATGSAAATATQSGANGSKQAAGNAEASNYPGLVMRKLSRAGKPRVDARGAAVVAFSIGGNGALSSVSLARSSGSGALDQAAVQLVRRAGPFPKPPQGARRDFSIRISAR